MTTPPPPWEAHPPTSDEDGYYGAEPSSQFNADSDDSDDVDTGPVRIVAPQPGPPPAAVYQPPPVADVRPRVPQRPAPMRHDPFADRFAEPMTVAPRTTIIRRVGGIRPVLISGAIAGAVLVILAVFLLWPSGGESGDTAPQPTKDSAAVARLKALLPAGYSSDACASVDAPSGAEAKVTCGPNSDADGPPTATYTLLKDGDALKAAMEDVIANAGIVNCPGNILSPGPWRRNAAPTKVAGNLVCGLPQGKPMIAWTNDADSLLGMVRAGPSGPTLDQLYGWWSNHS